MLSGAHYASDPDVKRTWVQLSDLWLQVRLNNERSEVAGKAENSARSVVAAERAIGRARNAMKMADRLRVRLALSD